MNSIQKFDHICNLFSEFKTHVLDVESAFVYDKLIPFLKQDAADFALNYERSIRILHSLREHIVKNGRASTLYKFDTLCGY